MRRFAMGGMVALLALTGTLFTATAAPVAASGGSCTGWTSRVTPPKTIRVLLVRSGVVRTVPFHTYVARVMASGEWPTYLPHGTLVAGGFAVKQYAWYHALKGHHRSGYVNRAGRCYDVRNDTNDQLYSQGAHPTKKQLRALDQLWQISLRRNGRFILTGYRAANTSNRCAADIDGWHLFERSASHCSRIGMSGLDILRHYYGGRLVRFVHPR
jgi:hypothetical protein